MTDEEISELRKAIDRVELNHYNASKIMESINTQRMFLHNAEVTKRQGKTAAKQAKDYSKCLEVARRIVRGDKIPPKNEYKLLKFSAEMYQTAKMMAAAARNEKAKITRDCGRTRTKINSLKDPLTRLWTIWNAEYPYCPKIPRISVHTSNNRRT